MFQGKFVHMFQSLYSQLKAYVKVKGGVTSVFEYNIGTKQGGVSSPVMFSLFINALTIFYLARYVKYKLGSGVCVCFLEGNKDDDFYADDWGMTFLARAQW